MEFEELYRETQKRSVASQQKTSLNLDGQTISNGSQSLTVPKGIQAPSGQSITFDRAGGNSSLAKVEFQTSKGAIRYQLYLGNGKIKRIKETKIKGSDFTGSSSCSSYLLPALRPSFGTNPEKIGRKRQKSCKRKKS